MNNNLSEDAADRLHDVKNAVQEMRKILHYLEQDLIKLEEELKQE